MPLPQKLQWCFFIMVALMKVSLIAGFFMHLRYEKLSLIYTIVLPLMLLVGLIAAIMPDGVSVLHMR
jgi:cytochrome c oxidase subunit IV